MKPRRLLLALAYLIVLGFAGLAPGWLAPEKKVGPVTVPFELLPSNHIVLDAKINGKGPYRLVFDVGAPVTLLSNKAGEGSGVVKKDAPKSFLMGMRGEGKVDTLQIGDLKAEGLPVIVLDHPTLKALAGMLGKPLDGLIGYTFFARYKTTIDYQAKLMSFEPVDSKIRDLMKELPERLAGPKIAKKRTLAPTALWGLTIGEPSGGVSSRGVPVTLVVAGSPADEAGITVGDVMTTLDGRWTTTPSDAIGAAAGVKAGQPTAVVVLRDNEELTMTVTPKDGI